MQSESQSQTIALPPPKERSTYSIEKALRQRKSTRSFEPTALSLTQVAQLLWAGHGLLGQGEGYTVPSAGALYPLVLYLVAGEVEGLASGVHRYSPEGHELVQVLSGDIRPELAEAAHSQSWLEEAPVSLAVAAVVERTTSSYWERGVRYVHMEVGHAAQNVYLQAAALRLGTVAVGAFDDAAIKDLLDLPPEEDPFLLLPVGRPAD